MEQLRPGLPAEPLTVPAAALAGRWTSFSLSVLVRVLGVVLAELPVH